MNEKKKNVPQLRFPGFTDAWEQRKVSELADRYDNHRVPITASERVAGGTPYYGANGIQDHVEGFTHDGEFILVAEDGANDLQNYPVQYVDGKVWVNNHAHVLQAKEETADNKFLMNALKHTNIEPYLVGGGRAKLNADVMMKIDFKVPTLPEQIQIGKFFDNLDHLITLHQRKLSDLKKLKNGLLQKMFPKNGEKYPEIRFPEFTDAWEQRKLGELGKIYTGNTPKTSDLDNWTDNKQGHIWITPTDIDKLIMSDSDRHLSEQGWSKARKIPENSVLITSIASIGKNTINAVPVAFNQQINAIVPEKNDSYFILSAMIKDTARFASVAGQTATAIINKTTFEKFQIATPSYEEQQKIGSFFKQLDDTITLHQRELDHLQLQKKALLQQMFV
ncbi:restriction endonuclease subunit S [Lapidilactobacillus achengensis]|uniref:Restriction endonuclease subunit S n=1 Tax=Lapidilactobacillus achengensis TaxID=2486000 RepID=A0ABW1UJJ0_9LACO|nr:restriction endonuclease subunit S [Lapidilactobacillus achengensis]